MVNSIRINSTKLPIRDYNGQRVVTFKDIDTVHERKDGTAKRNFYTNRERFVEGVDFFKVKCSEVGTKFVPTPNGYNPNADLMLITESGYLMLAKSFTDDLAWKVQRELVNNYFRVKAPEPPKPEQPAIETSEYHYFPKTLNGEPVITIADFEHFTGISGNAIHKALRKFCNIVIDYIMLAHRELVAFKTENHIPKNKLTSTLVVIKKSGVEKLLRYYDCTAEIPMIEEKAAPAPKTNSTDPNECVIALGVLGAIRESLKKAENTEAVEAFEIAIKQTAWELSKRAMQ